MRSTVIFNSPAEGSTVSAGALTETFLFSEEMDKTLLAASAFDLHRIAQGLDYAPASFSFDLTGTQLTINYLGLPVDHYTDTLFANKFADLVGLSLAMSGPHFLMQIES